MYDTRSLYVHHALETDFEMEDLKNIQITIQTLIGKIIEKSYKYSKKDEMLNEIDEAILNAY